MKRLIILLCLIGIGIALIGCQMDWSKFKEVAEPQVKTQAAKEEILYVSDLEPVASRGEVLKNINPENHLISLNGLRYEKGLCVTSPSDVTYDITGYTRFKCVVGHDGDYPEYNSELTFAISVDGQKVYESKPLGASDSEEVDIPVEGSKLTLSVRDNGFHTRYVVWADAGLF